MTDLLIFIGGLALGGLLGWFIGVLRQKSLAGSADGRLEVELRQNLSRQELEATSLRSQLSGAQASLAAAEAQRAAAEDRLAEQRLLYADQTAESRRLQDKALSDLREAFKALSLDALKETQPEFLRLARESLIGFQETAKGDLGKRQEAIGAMLKPLEEQLKIYQQRLAQSENQQSSTLGEVKKHLQTLELQSQSLSNETLQLRRVLSSNQARGRWGEETLRRVVEAAGMSVHCDFCEQSQSGDGKPDLIVNLPGNRSIIVDSKVPDLDFLAVLDAADPVRRSEALKLHAEKVRQMIKGLSDRDYPSKFVNALDHVVLFLPAESLFSAALEGDAELIIWAAQRQITLATPATLIALLRAVSLTWQQHFQTENARAIASAAQEFYGRVCIFVEHFDNIRKGLERASNAYNQAVGSYEKMVRPSGEKLLKLGGGIESKLLPEIPNLSDSWRLRGSQAEDLTVRAQGD